MAEETETSGIKFLRNEGALRSEQSASCEDGGKKVSGFFGRAFLIAGFLFLFLFGNPIGTFFISRVKSFQARIHVAPMYKAHWNTLELADHSHVRPANMDDLEIILDDYTFIGEAVNWSATNDQLASLPNSFRFGQSTVASVT
ncbi:hypothetical protein EV421DRAFT_1732942 [Armillaria borealis]|uniref:Uncharacterized protein n=1 Tax=Armillaria borealis TaxID=47425 RepID=A0AA39MW05_9AGAR|nr:hypothetical protein EV421DRAFT_1732942 [Armillaria borealis]